jgi:plastocyanin
LTPLLLVLGLAGWAGCATDTGRTPQPAPASLAGRLVADGERLSRADLARAVVYLEPIGSGAPNAAPTPGVLRHGRAALRPGLLAVAPGDEVWFLNDDTLFHGAFSYSKPNAFDLGTYGPAEHRRIRFEQAGVVRVHCPLHPDESGVVFVTPTRLVTRPGASGRYDIQDIAPGRYWLRAWADGLAETRYDVTLRPGEAAFRDIILRPTS